MTTTVPLPKLPFAVFDEFGQGADDRMLAYGDAREVAARAEMQAKLDALKNQEPAYWMAVLDLEQRPQQIQTRLHVVGFRDERAAKGFIDSELDFNGWRYTLKPLYLAAGASPKLVEAARNAMFTLERISVLDGFFGKPMGDTVNLIIENLGAALEGEK